MLAHREGLAEEIAAAVDGVTQDFLDAVRVGRLVSQVSVKRALELSSVAERSMAAVLKSCVRCVVLCHQMRF